MNLNYKFKKLSWQTHALQYSAYRSYTLCTFKAGAWFHIPLPRHPQSQEQCHNNHLKYPVEVSSKYIDEQIKVRYDPTQLDKAYIFDDDGKYIDTIYPIYKIDNSRVIRSKDKNPVDFSPFNVQEVNN